MPLKETFQTRCPFEYRPLPNSGACKKWGRSCWYRFSGGKRPFLPPRLRPRPGNRSFRTRILGVCQTVLGLTNPKVVLCIYLLPFYSVTAVPCLLLSFLSEKVSGPRSSKWVYGTVGWPPVLPYLAQPLLHTGYQSNGLQTNKRGPLILTYNFSLVSFGPYPFHCPPPPLNFTSVTSEDWRTVALMSDETANSCLHTSEVFLWKLFVF